ncbi:hypothetical protein like AT3G14470 [Hibiscus trionum]|uniref:Disease resistance protein RGA3 n=1 Tax=Hibiscus trionum TaxID=183268 RepID=A0A9W7HMX5_HIBTR|nr:hypothetical protein like AT3G14470 [Hibiscus trionum]
MAESIAFDIITTLGSPLLQQLGLWWNLKDDLQDLKSIVSAIKAVLLDAEEKSASSNRVKDFLEKLKDVLYDADDLLDDIRTEAQRKDLMSGNKLTKEVRVFLSSTNQVAYGLKMGRKIKAIMARLSSIQSEANTFNFVEREHPVETPFMARRRQQTHSFVRKNEIIGREDDKAALLKLLLDTEFESEENVFVIPIVGIGGLGKTALAQLVYNEEMDEKEFELKMWVCVSDVFDVRIIVENIIKSVTNQELNQNLGMDQLQKQLRDKIDGKKYLLVLDDIWNEDRELWFSLKKLLMGGARGSRIIVTTRSHKVAKITSRCQPHVLKRLSNDDAWSLFKDIAFEQRSVDSTNSAFVEIGKQVLERCGGVPLVIRAIAGTLSFKETENEWLSIKDNELARISQNDDKVLSTLKLSYDHLPSYLKHCFAYCAIYSKDYKIVVQNLVQFWIAQGFVKQSDSSQSLEEIGFGYFNGLVERCFFQELEEDEFWGMTCKMHDFMHDVAESIAGRESNILDSSRRELDEKCRHISFDFSSISLLKGNKLRTLKKFSNKKVEFMSNANWALLISNCKRLRVLVLGDLSLDMVPRSIHKLKHLRYLDVSWSPHIKFLPKSICKIQNLQVLKLDFCIMVEELPKKIDKLVNLTHLGLEGCWSLTRMPRGIGKLTSLQRLSMFVVDKDSSHGAAAADLSELSGLNNLRGELRITNLGFVKNAEKKFKAANLKEKQHLQSLVLLWSGDRDVDDDDYEDEKKSLEDLKPHCNLKKLSVVGWRGNAKFPGWLSSLTNLVDIGIKGPSKFKHLPSFARLPHLRRLNISKLTELEYMDDISDPSASGGQGDSESFFPSLTSLTLSQCPNMQSWWRKRPFDGEDEDRKVIGTPTMAFPCLSFLHIEDCPLNSMPLYPSVDDELRLVNTSSRPLKQTIQMSGTMKTPSTSSPPLSKLKSFEVENIEELDLDLLNECLQNMTSLKQWAIGSCHWLKSLSGWLQQLTGLKRLKIKDCGELDLEGMQWELLKNLSDLEINNLPQLVSLPTWLQHLVQLKSLEIKKCSGLRSLFPVFQHLTSLESLQIFDCEELELSADGIQTFQDDTRSLSYLCLENIPKCRHLPEWLHHLTSLRVLHLHDLPNLASFPDEMHCLTSLELLDLRFLPELPNWNKIAHIPHIWVNAVPVQ